MGVLSMIRVTKTIGIGVALATMCAVGINGGVVSAASVSEPLIEGLAGPLGLAVGSDGTVYVTESFAAPGKLTAIDKHGATTVLAENAEGEIAGVDAQGKGTLVYTRSTFAGEESPPMDGSLEHLLPNGKIKPIANLFDYEYAVNPDQVNTYGLVGASAECTEVVDNSILAPASYPGYPDSHPYAVAIVPGGYLVADAGSNTIARVASNGQISTLAVLPPVASTITPEFAAMVLDDYGVDVSVCIGETYFFEPVPTDVEVGPDGNYYVSTLPGSEAPGDGAIWMINAATGQLSQVAGGLFTPVDIAISDDGTIYVAELYPGRIAIVSGGAVSGSIPLDSPGAIEIGPDGTIYATTGVFGNGAVVTITP